MHTITGGLRCFLGSSWLLPVGAAAALVTGVLLDCCVEWVYDAFQIWPLWLYALLWVGGVLFWAGVLAGLTVPLWLVVMSVRLLGRGEGRRLLRCWGAAALAAVVALGVGFLLFVQSFAGGYDTFARGLSVPEDRVFVLPRGMTFFCNFEIPPRVRKLIEMKQRLPDVVPDRTGGEAVSVLMVPNLEKLSREAPELLQEYMLRALYAEATDPCFHSPVLAGAALYPDHEGSCVYPAHVHDPQTHALRAYLAERRVFSPEGESTEADAPAARWRIPLHHGWFVAHLSDWRYGDKDPVLDPRLPGELRRLDAALAPLAEEPTRERLDALLPPVPDRPFLCVWDDNAGIYVMLIVIPADYEAGAFELRAHEVTTGRRISFAQRWRDEVRLGDVCRLICSDDHCTVYSGDWGEYYGSEWEIWFTPAAGGEARCVNRQPFLMMGWQR